MEREQFNYKYSAKEQEEIKAIREKYILNSKEEDNITKLRNLDINVTNKAKTIALIIGVIGTLILGFGMSLVLTDLASVFNINGTMSMIIGIIIGLIGIILVSIAYPIYALVLKIEREKIAPLIIRLTDELLK